MPYYCLVFNRFVLFICTQSATFTNLKDELEKFVYGEEEVSLSICKEWSQWRLSFRSKTNSASAKTFLMLCKLVNVAQNQTFRNEVTNLTSAKEAFIVFRVHFRNYFPG